MSGVELEGDELGESNILNIPEGVSGTGELELEDEVSENIFEVSSNDEYFPEAFIEIACNKRIMCLILCKSSFVSISILMKNSMVKDYKKIMLLPQQAQEDDSCEMQHKQIWQPELVIRKRLRFAKIV